MLHFSELESIKLDSVSLNPIRNSLTKFQSKIIKKQKRIESNDHFNDLYFLILKIIFKQIPWDAGYQENVKTISLEILSNDNNQFISNPDGSKTPNIALIKASCPKNCSDHGTCNDNGECDCDAGYSQVDCSIKLSDAPRIIGLSTKKNAIDSSLGNPKDIIISLARFVAENSDSKIKVSIHVSILLNFEFNIFFEMYF